MKYNSQGELLVSGSGGSTINTPSLFQTSTIGTISSGKKSVNILNIGSANGVVLGCPIQPGISIGFSGQGETLAAIPYDATGTTFLIGVTE